MRRQLAWVVALTGVAQILGFAKLWLTAQIFGVSALLDGYNLAYTLPILIAGLISGVVQAALFPTHARLQREATIDQLRHFESIVVGYGAALSLVLSLALSLASPWLTTIVAAGAPSTVQAATELALRIAATAIAFNVLTDLLGYLLALRERYPLALVGPIINAAVGLGILAAWSEGGLEALLVSTVGGSCVQLAYCAWAAWRSGFRWQWGGIPMDQQRHLARSMFAIGWPILPGMAFAGLALAVPPMLLARFGEGAVSAFGYASRLHQSAIQLLVIAASPVILARFSSLVATSDAAGCGRLLRLGAWLSFSVGTLAIAGVALLGEPVLTAVFEGGQFDAAAVSQVQLHWAVLTLCLPFALWGNVTSKFMLANGKTGQMSTIAGLGLLALLVSFEFTRDHLGEYSVSAAVAAGAAVSAVLLWGASAVLLNGRIAAR